MEAYCIITISKDIDVIEAINSNESLITDIYAFNLNKGYQILRVS